MSAWILTDRAKYGAKCVVAFVLYSLGLLHLWKLISFRRRAVVLVYHRVLPNDAADHTWSHRAIIVTRDTFERHMRLLRRHFCLLTIDEFEQKLLGRSPFDRPSCLVTFDDGWADNYTEAWPVLKRHGVPATVYLSVDFIGSAALFWQERLGALLFETWRRAQADRTFAGVARRVLEPYGLQEVLESRSRSARDEIRDTVRRRKQDASRMKDAIAALSAFVTASPDQRNVDTFMTWAQAREMACDGVSFGGHGATHRILTQLSPDELEDELGTVRRTMMRELHADVRTFSYPNGDWNRDVAAAVLRERYTLAFVMDRGPVECGDNPMAVRRVNMFEDVSRSAPMFLARVLGLF